MGCARVGSRERSTGKNATGEERSASRSPDSLQRPPTCVRFQYRGKKSQSEWRGIENYGVYRFVLALTKFYWLDSAEKMKFLRKT